MSRTIFISVNEEGEPYDTHEDLVSALKVLEEFPNDTIVIAYNDSPTALRLIGGLP